MEWSGNLGTLWRGIRGATRIVKAKLKGPGIRPPQPVESSRMVEFSRFGDNPGRLRMRAHLPPSIRARSSEVGSASDVNRPLNQRESDPDGFNLKPSGSNGRPLVVLLHGCGQDATQFATDSGWIELADRLRFPLILPEQAKANDSGRCFRWFQPSDTARDAGEAGSIAGMTRTAIRRFDSDPRRIFVVGLSAGGAMTAALLAAYPDLFTAGASVAGLPVGAARSRIQAIRRMISAGPDQSPENWAAHVRAAAPADFAGPWPRLSVWQGQADTTVAPANGVLLATQWRTLHGLTGPAMAEQVRNGVRHQMWRGTGGPAQRLVELWSLPHLPHAYPAGTRAVAPGRFVEQAPVDATAEIARFFGLD